MTGRNKSGGRDAVGRWIVRGAVSAAGVPAPRPVPGVQAGPEAAGCHHALILLPRPPMIEVVALRPGSQDRGLIHLPELFATAMFTGARPLFICTRRVFINFIFYALGYLVLRQSRLCDLIAQAI